MLLEWINDVLSCSWNELQDWDTPDGWSWGVQGCLNCTGCHFLGNLEHCFSTKKKVTRYLTNYLLFNLFIHKRNPVYRRYWVYWSVQIVAPIQYTQEQFLKSLQVSNVRCHMSLVIWLVSHVRLYMSIMPSAIATGHQDEFYIFFLKCKTNLI